MNDFVSNRESAELATSEDGTPEFGLIDVIEAFTAMRHDWRGQTKAGHAAVEAVQAAASQIEQLQARLLEQVAGADTDDSSRLAELIAETDHQLTRAVAVASGCETQRRQRHVAESKAIQDFFSRMNPMARWFARPLLSFVCAQREAGEPANEDPAVEGLKIVLAQLRRSMKERQIERVDVVGQAFDAEIMNAIGTVVCEQVSAGHVAEQLSPGYRWRGNILRFAEVRVAS